VGKGSRPVDPRCAAFVRSVSQPASGLEVPDQADVSNENGPVDRRMLRAEARSSVTAGEPCSDACRLIADADAHLPCDIVAKARLKFPVSFFSGSHQSSR
jgi:hypothetical protein